MLHAHLRLICNTRLLDRDIYLVWSISN